MEGSKKSTAEIKAEESLPGAAINAADCDKVSEQAEKERTDVLDSNPRTEDDKMP